ncbi:hypothetical protein AB5J62_18080 [Amycolatopsis sp. cg5]
MNESAVAEAERLGKVYGSDEMTQPTPSRVLDRMRQFDTQAVG